MTGCPAPGPAPDGSGLLARLMAVVRPEFRVDILVPGPGALIFNAGPCRVAGCLRMPWTRKLCRGHYYRWKQDGRPDMEVFAASACPDLLGRKELTGCVVAGCRFGGARRGLCVRHHGFWERAGKPDRTAWLASLPAVADEGHAVCSLSFCTLWRQGNSPFCVNHKSRWEFAGRPDIGEFIVICQSKGDDRFDFRPLAGRRQLKLELQYALQCRHDERHVNTASGTVRRTITLAAASNVTSLLDLWGLEIRFGVVTCGQSGGDVVLVGESAENLLPADPVLGEADRFGWPGIGLGRGELAEGTVPAGSVIVPQVFGQHPSQVVLIDDQHPVEEFPAQGADDSLADRVAPHRQLHPIRTIGTGASG